MPKEIGMPFRDDMAEAIRKGLKTQTRIPMDPQPPEGVKRTVSLTGGHWVFHTDLNNFIRQCPLQVGDRIFVQEEIKYGGYSGRVMIHYRSGEIRGGPRFGGQEDARWELRDKYSYEWMPAKEMPSWAARTWLEVVKDPFPQRIRDISEADCIAEGMPAVSLYSLDCDSIAPSRYMKKLCESIYPGSWERNDWVFALTFKLVEEKGGGK